MDQSPLASLCYTVTSVPFLNFYFIIIIIQQFALLLNIVIRKELYSKCTVTLSTVFDN